MKPNDAIVIRLRKHLASVPARYPQAWEQLAMFRRGKAELGGWPAWCDVPLSAAYAIVSEGRGGTLDPDKAADIAVIGGLGTWRLTQGVYRYDPDLLEALWTTPIERVPVEMLYRLPEWCVYLDISGRMEGLYGAFVWLEWDTQPPHRTELRTLMDYGDYLLPVILHLTSPTLDECIDAALGESLRHMPETATMPAGTWDSIRRAMHEIWPPLISLTLYLCSEAPDVIDERGEPGMPQRRPARKKDGTIIPASAPRSWVIGSRIGHILRSAPHAESAGGTHASPRAHVRRAHWHTYAVGTGRTERKLRWLHPILVGAGADLPVTVHPVE